MRLRRSVLARFWLVCLLGLISPLTAHAQFVLNIRSPHPQIDPAIRSLVQACSSQLNAAATVSNSGDLNVDLSNAAVSMVTGNRAGLENELQSARRYAAGAGPGAERTRTEARICIRQAALNGAGAPAITPPGPTDGGVDLAGEWLGEQTGNGVAITMRPGGIEVAPATQNLGQTANAMIYREVSPGRYQLTFPDGSSSVAEVEAIDALRVTNSSGWTDLFRRNARSPTPSNGAISMEWFAGLWSGRADCAFVVDLRPDGAWVTRDGSARWRIEDGNVLVLHTVNRLPLERLDENTVRVVGNPQGFMYRCVAAGGSASGYARAGAPSIASAPAPAPKPAPEPPATERSPQDTAVARVRLAGLYGTRCVIPSIRNVRRPQEANPAPTSWIGEWVLTNHCPIPQWVRIEVDALGHLAWAGLQTPGARMQPSPALEPSLAFQPIREGDFHFGWLVPANDELVTASGDVVHASVIDRGMDVWIASCDGIGDARRQAIYLSSPFRDNPRVACWNHALPNGVGDGR